MRFIVGRDRANPSTMMEVLPDGETIRISPGALRRLDSEPELFWQGIRHEVAHLQAPHDLHGKAWRARAVALKAGGRTWYEAEPAKIGRPLTPPDNPRCRCGHAIGTHRFRAFYCRAWKLDLLGADPCPCVAFRETSGGLV